MSSTIITAKPHPHDTKTLKRNSAMSTAAASMGSAERPTESEQTVYDTAATVETGQEMQEPASQAGDEEQETCRVSYRI